MPIYENINCPLNIGDVVRRAPGAPVPDPSDAEDDAIPDGLLEVTRIESYSAYVESFISGYFRDCPYWVELVDYRTKKIWGITWVGYLTKDTFMNAARRANGNI